MGSSPRVRRATLRLRTDFSPKVRRAILRFKFNNVHRAAPSKGRQTNDHEYAQREAIS